MSSPPHPNHQVSTHSHDDPELLDWLDDMEKTTYYECYDSTTSTFFYYNEETGDETTEEPDESLYHIVRYTETELSPPWIPPQEQETQDANLEGNLQAEFFVIPAIASREPSITSVASLCDLPTGVELSLPYQTLLSHLRASDVVLDGWRNIPREEVDGQQEPGRFSRSVSIVDGEIPTDNRSPVVELFPRPRKRRRMLKWGLLGGAIAIAGLLLIRRR